MKSFLQAMARGFVVSAFASAGFFLSKISAGQSAQVAFSWLVLAFASFALLAVAGLLLFRQADRHSARGSRVRQRAASSRRSGSKRGRR